MAGRLGNRLGLKEAELAELQSWRHISDDYSDDQLRHGASRIERRQGAAEVYQACRRPNNRLMTT